MPLSPNALAEAKLLRNVGMSWKNIAKKLHVGEYMMRCELQPGYRQNCVDRVKRIRMGYLKKSTLPRPLHRGPPRLVSSGYKAPALVVPDTVLADRDRRAAIPPASITAALMGDPPKGRSALDMRKPRLVVSNQEGPEWTRSNA